METVTTKAGDRKRRSERQEHHDHPYATAKYQRIGDHLVSSAYLERNQDISSDSGHKAVIIRSISPQSRPETTVLDLSEILKNVGIPVLPPTGSADVGQSTSYQSCEVSVQTSENDDSLDSYENVDLKPPLTPESKFLEDQEPNLTLPKLRHKVLDGSVSLSKYCQSFLENRHPARNIKCNICGLIMRYADAVHGSAVEHARKHLDKPLLQCLVCNHTENTMALALMHLHEKHRVKFLFTNLIDLTKINGQYREELLSMLERCLADPNATCSDSGAIGIAAGTSTPETTQMMGNSEKEAMRKRALDRSVSFVDYCQYYLKDRLQDKNVRCNICGTHFYVIYKDRICCDHVYAHVGNHLGKYMVQCRQCDEKAYSLNLMKLHLRDKHTKSLNGNVIYLTDTNNKEREEFISMLERCFGDHSACYSGTGAICFPDGTVRSATVSPIPTQLLQDWENEEMRKKALDGSLSFVNYCKHFLKDRHQENQVTCNICFLSLRIINSRGFCGDIVWNHVGKHLSKALLQCRLCKYEAFGLGFMKWHFQDKHKGGVTGNYIDLAETNGQNREELIIMLERCFGDVQQESSVDDSLSLRDYCQRAVNGRFSDGSIRCGVCDTLIQVTNYQSSGKIYRTFDHAVKHMRPLMYSCRLCSYSVAMKYSALQHLKKVHNESRSTALIDDRTENYQDEIKAVIDYCYGGLSIKQNAKYDISKETLNHLLQARNKSLHVRCTQLVDKFERKKRLECLLCSKTVLVRAMNNKHITRFAIDHVAEHLGKQLYQCKHCVKWTSGHQPMMMHIIQRHRTSARGGYIDHSYKYVDELLRLMARCYSKDEIISAITVQYEDDSEPSTSTGKVHKKRNKVLPNTRNRPVIKKEPD